jgi:hypothetical protein
MQTFDGSAAHCCECGHAADASGQNQKSRCHWAKLGSIHRKPGRPLEPFGQSPDMKDSDVPCIRECSPKGTREAPFPPVRGFSFAHSDNRHLKRDGKSCDRVALFRAAVLFKLQSGLPPGDIVINAGKILTREPASLTTILGARLRGKFGTLLLSSFVGRYHKEEARRAPGSSSSAFKKEWHTRFEMMPRRHRNSC